MYILLYEVQTKTRNLVFAILPCLYTNNGRKTEVVTRIVAMITAKLFENALEREVWLKPKYRFHVDG